MADEQKPNQPPAFELPAELKDKGPEDVARYYSDRYKDYDTLKSQAAEAAEWSKFGKRDELQNEITTYSKIKDALRQGKVIVTDDKGMLYARDPQDLTPAQRQQAAQNPMNQQAQGGDIDDDAFDEMTPRQQRAYYRKLMKQQLDETVAAKEREWGAVIQNTSGGASQMVNTVLEIQAALQENPSIKLRDILPKMATYAAQGAPNPLKAALDDFLGPAQIEQKAEARAAEIIAQRKLEDEKKKAEKQILSGSPLANMMRGGKKNTGRVTNAEIIAGLSEKGLLN